MPKELCPRTVAELIAVLQALPPEMLVIKRQGTNVRPRVRKYKEGRRDNLHWILKKAGYEPDDAYLCFF